MTELTLAGPPIARGDEILTGDALAFLAELHARFAARRDELVAARSARRGKIIDFPDETRAIREAGWRVAAVPADLVDRRVEITGPTTRKMAINALNSGAKVWLADLEDANTPHWANVIGGQVNLADAVRRTISYTGPDGRDYRLLDGALATIVVRPRGWHLDERHIRTADRAGVAALVDFGLYFFHNATELIGRGSGPYFYLPKTESYLEARLWNDVFTFAEEYAGIPAGTIRATVLIETIPAAFQMDEILYELRDHASGLNAGRWDYLFSIIKNFRDAGPAYVLPDRASVTMAAPFMRAYTDLLVATCHRRGAYAIGGMAAFIPSRSDREINARAFAKVTEDKTREVRAGFDGSWVAHPDLVPVCAAVFDETLGDRPNQLDVLRADVTPDPAALLDLTIDGTAVTEAGLRTNVEVALRYLAAWLDGNGAVAIHNLMEDAATAEISRSQLWQWVHNGTLLSDGRTVTADLVRAILAEESAAIRAEIGEAAWPRYAQAATLFEQVALADEFPDFLTTGAYALIASDHNVLPRATPESQGISSAAILRFVQALEAQIDEVHSFVLLRYGTVIAEGGWAPYRPTQPHVLMSVSKSFTSTAVGIAIAEGLFALDDTVLSFFPGEAPAEISENLAAMRVRHLLSMSTGHPGDTLDDGQDDWIRGFLETPVEYPPGTHFAYNTGATYVLSAIVEKTSGLNLVDYLEPRLFAPLGIATPYWMKSPQGITAGGFGLSATTEDVARLGQLYLQKGVWQGRQVVPAEWVDEATKLQIDNAPNVAIDWRQGYGYQFWRCRHNAYRGDGAFGQYCVVLPDHDVVLAMTGGLVDMQPPLDLVWDILLPGIDSEADAVDLSKNLSELAIPPIRGGGSSPVAADVSGRSYTVAPNEFGLERIAFNLDGGDHVVTITIASRTESIACGSDVWELGRTSLFDEGWMVTPTAIATSGAWTADDTYTLVVRYYESMFYRTLTFRFDGGDVTVTTALNVGFQPPPTLVFTATAAA